MTPSSLLAAHGLGRRDPRSERWLLRGVELELFPGDRALLSGPSGSGKTVLLRSLALLDGATEGEVLWHGDPIADRGVPAYRSRVHYLQQRSPLVEGTVESNLELPFTLHSHRNRSYDRRRAAELLDRLGREESFLDQTTSDLSGGERQITALVRAFLLEPDVLLLDEPTSALDPWAAKGAVEMILGWVALDPDRRAFLWVSHQTLDLPRRFQMREGTLTSPPSR